MKTLSSDELSALIEGPQEMGVSIYMPTHRTGEVEQDPIRLRNLLREAAGQLVDCGISISDAGGLLEPAEKLLLDWSGYFHFARDISILSAPL